MVDLFEIQCILFELFIPRGLVEIWNRDGRRIKYFPPYSLKWVGLLLHYIKFPNRWSDIQSWSLESLLFLSLMELAFTLTVASSIFGQIPALDLSVNRNVTIPILFGRHIIDLHCMFIGTSSNWSAMMVCWSPLSCSWCRYTSLTLE